MPRITPARESEIREALQNLSTPKDPKNDKIWFLAVNGVRELLLEIDALRHDAKSFTRNFEFLNDELKESEEKNKKLSKAVGAARDLLHVLRRTDAFSVDEIAESVIDLEEELDGEK